MKRKKRKSSEGWICHYCKRSDECWFVEIHGGKSLRQDCAGCGKTIGFPVWEPEAEEPKIVTLLGWNEPGAKQPTWRDKLKEKES